MSLAASESFQEGRAFILSGAPGSGKTSIGQALAESAQRPTVHLITDGFYTAIKRGFIPPFLPEAAQQNEVVLRAAIDAMLAYLRGGYDVVVDGIIGPWSLPSFTQATRNASLELSFVVLRPSFEITLARATARAGKVLKASGPIRGLYGAFANLGSLESHVVDSTTESLEATVARVHSGLEAGRFLLAD